MLNKSHFLNRTTIFTARSLPQFNMDLMTLDLDFLTIYLFYYKYVNMASRGAAARAVSVKPTGCGFDPQFIFPFLRSGVEGKRDVEFCHSTRNASRMPAVSGERSVLTLGSLWLPC